MLKIEKGIIGGEQFVALFMEDGDRDTIIEVCRDTPKFRGSNGCGLNLEEILQGKISKPCTDSQYEMIEKCVEEFNEKYMKEDEVSYAEEYDKLLISYGELDLKYEKLLDELEKKDKKIKKLKKKLKEYRVWNLQ